MNSTKAVQTTLIAAFITFISACDNTAVSPNQVRPAEGLQCAVRDPDIGKSYKGECKDGYAHGVGHARGRDTYTGNFKNGLVHGQGTYEWGADSEWAGEKWEGVHYKGNRTGYGVLTLESTSKHIALQTGGYSGGETSPDGRRTISGAWTRGYQSQIFPNCKSEADCYGFIEKMDASMTSAVEKMSKNKQLNRVLTLLEIQTEIGTVTNPFYKCVIDENLDIYRETNSRVLFDIEDFSRFYKLSFEPKQLLSTLLDCEFRIQQNEDFYPKLSAYQAIEVTELRASLKWLVGKKVKVSGNVVSILSNFMFKDGPTDMSPIFLDTKKTGRRVLLYAMENCSVNAIHGCTAVISGTVANTAIGVGIALEEIEVTKKAQEGVY